MTINYLGTLKADICFNDGMTYHGMNDDYHVLQEYIDKAVGLMNEYNFDAALIVDCETDDLVVGIGK